MRTRSCVRGRAVCKTYRDSNKSDPREFMNGRAVVSRLAGRCSLELRAIDIGRISNNTKTTVAGRPGGKRCAERNETQTNIFLSLPAPSVAARAIITDPPRRDGCSAPEPQAHTADRARANLTHFRRTKSVPREHIFTFFFFPPTAESTARHHSDAPPSLSELFTSF